MQSETQVAKYALQLDILFVVDNSGSMEEEIDLVDQSLEDFIETMQLRRRIDFQAAVTVTDASYLKGCRSFGGCPGFDGGLVLGSTGDAVVKSATSANPVGEFRSLLQNIPTTPNSGWEQGLEAARDALQSDGHKYLRPGVTTALFIFSDEEDQSCPPGGSQHGCMTQTGLAVPVIDYVNFFRSRSDPVFYYPFAGKSPRQCPEVMSVSSRYWEVLAGVLNGNEGNICNSQITAHMQYIAELLESRGVCYTISANATGEQISVSVDGASVAAGPQGWVYDSPSHAVCFSGAFAPPEGASLVIHYEVKI